MTNDVITLNSFQRDSISALAAVGVCAKPLGNWLSIHGWPVMSTQLVGEIIEGVQRHNA